MELSAAKREQIIGGARAVFRDAGYERASVDAIAARAGVSKATIYNHFKDKKALFLATLGTETDQVRAKFLSLLETPSGDIDKDLRAIGTHLLKLISAPSHVARFRLVCGEVEQFPELGKSLYGCTVKLGNERLASFFARASEMGLIELDDPAEAAVNFSALCAYPLSRQLHLGAISRATDEAIASHVDRAVRAFLRAYPQPGRNRS